MTTKARQVNQLHSDATAYADESFVARLEKNREKYLHFTRLALDKETAAADLMVDELDIEPTRSVLHRSAATLAWRCGRYDEAEKLIYRALAGNPRSDIERELKDLLGTVNLAKAGIHLGEGQLQFSLHGNEVGFGAASVEELASRAPSVSRLLDISLRSALRNAQDSASNQLDEPGQVPVFIEGMAAGSCIVRLRVGPPYQGALPGFERYSRAIEPFLDYLHLLERSETNLLEKTIDDARDFRDFVRASIALAPDGDKISSVKFQANIDHVPREVSLNTPKRFLRDIPLPEIRELPSRLEAGDDDTCQVGVLKVANAIESTECVLVTAGGEKWEIEGAEELMDDLVRNYFNRRIEVKGKRMRKQRSVKRIQVLCKDDARLITDSASPDDLEAQQEDLL